ncbi:hypothetical protein H5410_056343 [Solanum commersonii]|uniref:MADS-box domain-containing protein n=1 Tax=Solanum commersonii TaxID=4109 RepID=A0A9J5WK02_SOLCO|nr:hypothetical protein H5410_056343 [Solanum commersonii]
MEEEDQSKKKTNNPKSYQERKECIKRKSMELATLCDIKVCTVINGPNGELQTWPNNLDAYNEVLDLYSQNLKPEKKHKNRHHQRIRFLENKNVVVVVDKGKRKRIE